jgi:hypothetical protein
MVLIDLLSLPIEGQAMMLLKTLSQQPEKYAGLLFQLYLVG